MTARHFGGDEPDALVKDVRSNRQGTRGAHKTYGAEDVQTRDRKDLDDKC